MIITDEQMEDAMDYAVNRGMKAYNDTEGDLKLALEETCKEFLAALPDTKPPLAQAQDGNNNFNGEMIYECK